MAATGASRLALFVANVISFVRASPTACLVKSDSLQIDSARHPITTDPLWSTEGIETISPIPIASFVVNTQADLDFLCLHQGGLPASVDLENPLTCTWQRMHGIADSETRVDDSVAAQCQITPYRVLLRTQCFGVGPLDQLSQPTHWNVTICPISSASVVSTSSSSNEQWTNG
jgi:hypothetical protein